MTRPWQSLKTARAAAATKAGRTELLRTFDAGKDDEKVIALGGEALVALLAASGRKNAQFIGAAESAAWIYASTERGKESLAVFDALLATGLALQPRTLSSLLWAVQDDNTHLGVDPPRARRYLELALPLASELPEIFFNACAVEMELGNHQAAIAHARDAALHGYAELTTMRRSIASEALFLPARGALLEALATPRPGFTDELLSQLPSTIEMPEPLIALFRWLEAHDCVKQDAKGGRYAVLHRNNEKPLGTQMSFRSPAAKSMASFAQGWLPKIPNAAERLCVFARTGGDGSYAALWRDDDGMQHIVHLGSGSGSTFLGIITSDPVAFLRLIAIGYPEICWSEAYAKAPVPEDDDAPLVPNKAYRKWVETKFAVSIPKTASVIVPAPADMDDDASDDIFNAWMRRQRA